MPKSFSSNPPSSSNHFQTSLSFWSATLFFIDSCDFAALWQPLSGPSAQGETKRRFGPKWIRSPGSGGAIHVSVEPADSNDRLKLIRESTYISSSVSAAGAKSEQC